MPAAASASAAPAGGVAIQIHSLTNIPDMDRGKDDVSDVYLAFQLFTAAGEPFGSVQKTTVFYDALDAVFGECYHTFRTPPGGIDGAFLRVKAYDKDGLSKDDKIARLDIGLAELAKAGGGASVRTIPCPYKLAGGRVFQTRRMEMDTKRRGEIADQPVSITLRLVPSKELVQCTLKKRFFLIRHGESLWNEAQDENNVKGLLKFDHALNPVGIEQCTSLNARWRDADVAGLAPAEKEFLACPAILCSPLTRCVQTALLSLHSHETLRTRGMVLQRNLREVKSTLGSLDTIGVEVGAENIRRRARDCLERACGRGDGSGNASKSKSKRKLVVDGVPPLTEEEVRGRIDRIDLETNDAASKWWTPRTVYDNDKTLGRRMDALMATLRYLPCDSAILVGHSLLFRSIMRTFLSEDVRSAEGGSPTREEMTARKMGNAAVAAVDVTFPTFPEEGNGFEITRVAFLFGTGLAEE